MEKSTAPEPKKPRNVLAWLLGLLALVGGAEGADYVGLDLPLEQLKDLGIVGAAMLIAYLHVIWFPVVFDMAGRMQRAFPDEQPAVEVAPAKRERDTKPRIAVVRPKEHGSAALALLCAIAVLGLAACGWLRSESRETAKNVVDCTSAEVVGLRKQFAPVVEDLIVQATHDDGSVDWSRIKHATRGFAVSSGLCVLAHVVQRSLVPVQKALDAPQSSALEADPGALRAGFRELAGGRTFKTELGDL
jgi:hypothetical protein